MITITIIDDDGWETEFKLPSKKEVCETCNGEGTHVNPAIDGNGITASEWSEWSDDEQEFYMNGGYDVTCEECKGQRVVDGVDEERLSDTARDAYTSWLADQALSRSIDAADRKLREWGV